MFAHLIPDQGMAKPQNRFAHLIPKATPQESNDAGKGNRELSWPDTTLDVVQSLGMGVNKGLIGLTGMPGGIADLTRRGVEFGADKLGFNGENAGKVFSKINPTSYLPRSDQIQSAIESKTGAFPEPKTTAGEFANTIGEFAPAAISGPGGLVRKAAMTVIPAVASEAAGQATKGTKLEPYARFTAAVLGGGLVAGGKSDLIKNIAKEAPAHEAVRAETNALYGQLKKAGIKYDSNSYDQMATDLARKLTSDGFRAAQAPMAADALKAIGDNVGKSLEYNDFESLRKIASKIVREKNATDTDKAAAGMIIEALDEFAGKASYIHNGSVSDAPALMKQAREMAKRNILGKQIEDMFAKAETYQSGYESGLRNQFSNYLRSNKAKGLSKTERQAFVDVAKGNFTSNALGTFGKLGIDFGKLGNRAALLPAAAAAGGYAADSAITGGATVLAATGAKYAARKMTRNAADRAKKTVLSGRKAQKAAQENRQKQIAETLIRRLVAGENARVALSSQPPD